MSSIIAINGSPRKNGNTAMLLEHALKGASAAGAQTEIIHLWDLNFKGCSSCFACKLKERKLPKSTCAMRDELTPVLNKVMDCNAVIIGSPIYFGDITGMLRSFLERLMFMNMSYDDPDKMECDRTFSAAFIYTMNVDDPTSKIYSYIYDLNQQLLSRFGGYTESYFATDTYQFNDYSRYAAGIFDAEKKLKSRNEKFPRDCKKVFEIGRKLATK